MLIETAVKRRLVDDAEIVRLASLGVHKHTLPVDVATTGKAALVIVRGGSWRRTLQTAKFPRLYVRAHADADRNGRGAVTVQNAEDKALALLAQVDRRLHVPFRFMEQWGGEDGPWVLGCNREVEPNPIVRPGETTVLFQAVYDLKVA